ncbi:hypothetical protein EST38_g13680 [Candolleomyces aberdarensis]|uniref:F-box domain-containing protein n=1 Tax=Candolleomyces aberdarensis TaxID=2316362 RepID=A0A4Q2D1L9_9AGAR|nr:hypothetical protein EST38_g13680 [Candolleomyces aberdarensis]
MASPNLPLELTKEIVMHCSNSASLITISLTLNLERFTNLLRSQHCTIPSVTQSLLFRLHDVCGREAQGWHNVKKIIEVANFVLQHITPKTVFQLEWELGVAESAGHPSPFRWQAIHHWHSLRSLKIYGSFPRLEDFLITLCRLINLEVLAVGASWEDDSILAGGHLTQSIVEIAVTPSSFMLLGWICAVESHCSNLQTLTLSPGPSLPTDDQYLELFLRGFGASLKEVFFSLYTKHSLHDWANLMQDLVSLESVSFLFLAVEESGELETFLHQWLLYFNSRILRQVLTSPLLAFVGGQVPDDTPGDLEVVCDHFTYDRVCSCLGDEGGTMKLLTTTELMAAGITSLPLAV